jgi:hypothetical protein
MALKEIKINGISLKAFNAAKEVKKWIGSGAKFVDKETLNNRETICKECIFYNHEKNTCKKCGCLMKIKRKMDTSKCPINKW